MSEAEALAAVERIEIKEDATTTPPSPTVAVDDDVENNSKDNENDDDNNRDGDDTKSLTSDTDKEEGEESDADHGTAPGTAEDVLIEASNLKEEGNNHFKDGDLDKAARAYRRGTTALKKLNKQNTGDEQVKALLVALHNNLSMVSFKQKKYKQSVDVATKALQIEPNNVKSLYRRAVAQRQLGNLEEARTDLKQAVTVEPTNAACKKELATLKKEIETRKESQKKALSKAFSSANGSFLYTDKEKEEALKKEAAERKKKEEQEAYKKRKMEWEDECVKRMANNQPAISFEEYEKELKDKEDAKRKEEEKKRKQKRAEERKAREAMRKESGGGGSRRSNSGSDDNDDNGSDEELTEQELAMMRGYKKTKDGRTTSYFTREISDDEKKRLGDIAPKRLDSMGADITQPVTSPTESSTSNNSSSPTRIDAAAAASSSGAGASAWNQAGTWEEKNCTTWCTEQLQKRLEETTASTQYCDVDITKVEELTGEGSVALAGGKKRYIFDYHARCKYEITSIADEGKKIASGVVKLPDICSTSAHLDDELEVVFDSGWSKKPKSKEHEEQALAARDALAFALRENVKRWVQDFNQQF